MARGINKVIIIGNLGADPEVRYMPSGGAVANIRVATTEGWKDKQSGENVEQTEWHRIVLFNRLGEIAGEYLRKGARVYIEGSLRTRKWQDKDGQDRYTTEIVARDMQMLDGRGAGSNVPEFESSSSPNKFQSQSKSSNQYQSQSAPPSSDMSNVEEFNDDIPF